MPAFRPFRRSSRPFRHHLKWSLLDVTLDLLLVGAGMAWALMHLRAHG